VLKFPQAKALDGHTGVATKNLFLKDKKGRLYIVTALPSTKVELPKLSARLGCGKSGLRFAPEELVPAVLGVPLGSVTPLALANPTAKDVVLLIDEGIRSQRTTVLVHPLDNTASLALTSGDLEAFLGSLGVQSVWVDFAAAPTVDKGNPPDLKAVADSATACALSVGEGSNAEATAASGQQSATTAIPSTSSKGNTAVKQGGSKHARGAASKQQSNAAPRRCVTSVADAVLGRAVAALGESVDEDVMRRLRADVRSELNALQNAAYAAGFKAANAAVVAALQGAFA
jgi:hypothetical protein